MACCVSAEFPGQEVPTLVTFLIALETFLKAVTDLFPLFPAFLLFPNVLLICRSWLLCVLYILICIMIFSYEHEFLSNFRLFLSFGVFLFLLFKCFLPFLAFLFPSLFPFLDFIFLLTLYPFLELLAMLIFQVQNDIKITSV